MDIDGILDDSTINQDALVITPAIRDFLSQSARWGKFMAIVGLAGMGLMLIGILLGGGSILMLLADNDFPLNVGGGGTIFLMIYVAFLALFIMPFIYLYNFSAKIQVALRDDNQTLLTDAFENHKSLFKFYGVFTAIIIGFYALIFLVSLLGSLGAALAI
jgi:hypothetical protein